MNKQTILVLVMLAVVTASIGIAILSTQTVEHEGSLTEAKQFRAKKGTMRSTVRPMLSGTQDRDSQQPENAPKASTDNPQNTGKSNAEANFTLQVHSSVLSAAARRALQEPVPERAIERLRRHLESGAAPEEISQANSAMAMMQLQVIPPDDEAAMESVELAEEEAATTEDKHSALYARATVLQYRQEHDYALQALLDADLPNDKPTVAGFKAALMGAGLSERNRDLETAKELYQWVLTRAADLPENQRKAAFGPFRVAALKLAQIYRNTGDEESAQALVDRVQTLQNNASLE